MQYEFSRGNCVNHAEGYASPISHTKFHAEPIEIWQLRNRFYNTSIGTKPSCCVCPYGRTDAHNRWKMMRVWEGEWQIVALQPCADALKESLLSIVTAGDEQYRTVCIQEEGIGQSPKVVSVGLRWPWNYETLWLLVDSHFKQLHYETFWFKKKSSHPQQQQHVWVCFPDFSETAPCIDEDFPWIRLRQKRLQRQGNTPDVEAWRIFSPQAEWFIQALFWIGILIKWFSLL